MRRVVAKCAVLVGVVGLVSGACGSSSKSSTPSNSPTTTSVSSQASGQQSLSLVTPLPASVKGNVVTLDLKADGVTIVKPDGDTSGKTAHYHVFIDRDPTAAGQGIPKEAGIIHTADNPVTLAGMTTGSHRIVVVLGDGNHTRLGTSQVEGTVKVEGPSVQASAPAPAPQGQDVKITAQVDGVQLVAPDGDTSGKTGHLHFFVDRPPTPAGQPIPKEAGIIHTADTTATLPGLTPGEHTVWIVVGDGAHVPLNPPVEAKVTFTVQ